MSIKTFAPRLVVGTYADALQTAALIAPAAITTEEIPARTETKLDDKAFLAAAQLALETTGEILPGVERIEGRETFKVTFGVEQNVRTGETNP